MLIINEEKNWHLIKSRSPHKSTCISRFALTAGLNGNGKCSFRVVSVFSKRGKETVEQGWIWVPTLLCTSWVTLGKFFSLSCTWYRSRSYERGLTFMGHFTKCQTVLQALSIYELNNSPNSTWSSCYCVHPHFIKGKAEAQSSWLTYLMPQSSTGVGPPSEARRSDATLLLCDGCSNNTPHRAVEKSKAPLSL